MPQLQDVMTLHESTVKAVAAEDQRKRVVPLSEGMRVALELAQGDVRRVRVESRNVVWVDWREWPTPPAVRARRPRTAKPSK